MMKNNTSTVNSDEQQKLKAEYDKEYRKRVKTNISDHESKEEQRARKAAHDKMLYAKKRREIEQPARPQKSRGRTRA